MMHHSKKLTIDELIDAFQLEQAESSQIKLALEYAEYNKAKKCFQWLLSVSKDSKNERLKDTLHLINNVFKEYDKAKSEAIKYKQSSDYYKMYYEDAKKAVDENYKLWQKLTEQNKI